MLIELERRFLADLKPDWLADVWIEDPSEGTCEWILDLQEFSSWLRPSGPEFIFWESRSSWSRENSVGQICLSPTKGIRVG